MGNNGLSLDCCCSPWVPDNLAKSGFACVGGAAGVISLEGTPDCALFRVHPIEIHLQEASPLTGVLISFIILYTIYNIPSRRIPSRWIPSQRL